MHTDTYKYRKCWRRSALQAPSCAQPPRTHADTTDGRMGRHNYQTHAPSGVGVSSRPGATPKCGWSTAGSASPRSFLQPNTNVAQAGATGCILLLLLLLFIIIIIIIIIISIGHPVLSQACTHTVDSDCNAHSFTHARTQARRQARTHARTHGPPLSQPTTWSIHARAPESILGTALTASGA